MTSIHENDPEGINVTIDRHENVIVDFWTSWCGPCIELDKHLAKTSRKQRSNLVILKIDTNRIVSDEEHAKMDKKGQRVYTRHSDMLATCPFFKDVEALGEIPVLVIFKNGSRIDTIIDTNLEEHIVPHGKGILFGYYDLAFLESSMDSNLIHLLLDLFFGGSLVPWQPFPCRGHRWPFRHPL